MAPGTPPPIAFFIAFWTISFPDFGAAAGASSVCTLAGVLLAGVLLAVVVGFNFVLLLRRDEVVTFSSNSVASEATVLLFMTLIEHNVLSTQASSKTATIRSCLMTSVVRESVRCGKIYDRDQERTR
mmetsp:Transcript_29653/g.59598  ORF Transcript_29653/g.59598 Transcript_29653/m.59598 type:complete len:127 (-) Transcript_29653:48-428(-)